MATIKTIASDPAHKDNELACRLIQDKLAFYQSIGQLIDLWLNEHDLVPVLPPSAKQRSINAYIEQLATELEIEV
jgi:hypothetical protein